MESKGWTAFADLDPPGNVCLNGYLLIWHIYRGAVCELWEHRHDTPMYTHWMPVPLTGWIPADAIKPLFADADNMNCVLALQEDGDIRVTGWHQFEHNRHLTHWMSTPPPPAGAIGTEPKKATRE